MTILVSVARRASAGTSMPSEGRAALRAGVVGPRWSIALPPPLPRGPKEPRGCSTRRLSG
ncbi:hypothetical protein HMPREF9597_00638 [Cutibacterium acnes HL005PA4]|uniref:Uncharacterized protein n=1 Tax=Cutibacterium acnes TaxID=1747 RepID=A0AA44U5P1_CUTAC|nr:hypothetical protein DXN06_07380 [Cutibacterium acnes]EFS66593.1 hypothetical protein HMPREF9612_00929 [Cutibacterium acnes HL063PA2]EFS80168.1 hypothetical protein HMPREF9597_00638 [Cutibacterium acnes HL005PA4]PGF29884.1 hypothetical protein B1B02_02420 [Cutibacterium acnes subsp. defendens]PGF33462.1 hypothetical protein B1B10_06415 [Cutibacterium acnes subsp. acnes]QAZ50127.1 hypothetical protein cbac_00615 [Cutibacterium acnes KPA171202]